ncbi:hypothetical protein SmJEL517_g01677 [Synchytrium microbalum]|uniref:Aminoglycoside phosphotransferase domain-containing protein n=1 Tax=Synchytrium microbalum TaxID=1806994 RepID=A0A507CD77_9FUNG|nr:uncharacterized protein SmJEL517_g01677 [Synchytrium microbalum]TPX35874.1 hypothetical protein SmJEL517_g01677 [Synchytrium microbalum]
MSSQALDVSKLRDYWQHCIPWFDHSRPYKVQQAAHGQGNPTFIITDATGKSVVLRKRPAGKLAPQLHRVDREYHVIKALESTTVPVPKALLLCEDESIIGTVFFVMSFLPGRIFIDMRLKSFGHDERRDYYYSAVKVLAQLHSINPSTLSLPSSITSKAGNFYAKQLVMWDSLSRQQAKVKDVETGEELGMLDRFDDILGWLKRNMPRDEVAVMHGDYKLDNLMFHATKPEVIGLLDWERWSLGHPLADLANLALGRYWTFETLYNLNETGQEPDIGIPSTNELVQWYCKESHRAYPIPAWNYARAFSAFQMAVGAQNVASRGMQRTSNTPQAIGTRIIIPELTRLVLSFVDRGDLKSNL